MWPFNKKAYRYHFVEGIDLEMVDHPRWKARILRTIRVTIPEIPFWYTITTKYFSIEGGVLTLRKGYSWDLASGPVKNGQANWRATAVHDCLYQCLRECYFPQPVLSKKGWAKDRKSADKVMKRIMKEDGTFAIRAGYWYIGVRFRGAKHAAPFCYYMENTNEEDTFNSIDPRGL